MTSDRTRRRIPVLIWVLVPIALLVFVGANAHLVYVAINSQPDCVPHLKATDQENESFRAAKSAC